MENQEILDKLENIEILLSTFIQSANDPQKRQKEAEFLNEVRKQTESLNNEIKGLVLEEKHLIKSFNPTVEVKHLHIDVKEPFTWIAGAVVFMLICFTAAFFTSRHYYNESEYYHQKANDYFDNNMKYKYIKMFWGDETEKALKAFDKEYDANWQKFGKKVEKRERELDEMQRATDEAKIKANEAMRLKQKADSLRNQ
jgi:hypothetical protein